MQKNMTDRTPGSYDDFVAYLGTVRTEEELFSRLTYWFAGQNRPEDVLSRSELVEARAKELGFWQGLTFRMERWLADGKSELEAVGREEFQSRIAEDYAAYREKADAARARFRDRRRAAPLSFTPDCLENVPIQNVSWLVDGLLPMGEVSLLGADGGTGKGIWQAQLIAYVTAGRTSGFFPQPSFFQFPFDLLSFSAMVFSFASLLISSQCWAEAVRPDRNVRLYSILKGASQGMLFL